MHPAFSTFPAGSKEGDSLPDGCFRPGSHLFEEPEYVRRICKEIGRIQKARSALKKVQGAPLAKTGFG